jgi:hypothetical protein
MKKMVSVFLAVLIALSVVSPAMVLTAGNIRFEGNGFAVDFNVIHGWQNGYNAQIVITNTGSEDIVDWVLTVNAYLGIAPWGLGEGVVLSQDDEATVITHQGWNGTIPVGGHISMWFSGSHSGTLPTPTHFALTGGGLGNGGNDDDNGNDDDDDTGNPAPGSMPYIRVLTEFPDGFTTLMGLDVEYIAIPSEGAYIRAVRYHNGNYSRAIYLSGTVPGSIAAARGTLGQGRVPIFGNENHISFSVEDSNGLVATFAVDNVPVGDAGFIPPDAETEFFASSSYQEGAFFITNRLLVRPGNERHNIPYNDFVEAFTSIDGTIIGQAPGLIFFTIQVPPNDEAGLNSLGGYLLDTYPHLFDSFSLETAFEVCIQSSGGGFFQSGVTSGSSFRTDDNWWNTAGDWAFHTIDLPWAWAVFGTQERQNVRVE